MNLSVTENVNVRAYASVRHDEVLRTGSGKMRDQYVRVRDET
jgi:hypothetical protein